MKSNNRDRETQRAELPSADISSRYQAWIMIVVRHCEHRFD